MKFDKKYQKENITQKQLAVEYNINQTCVSKIVLNQVWVDEKYKAIKKDYSKEKSPLSRLTIEQVHEIRQRYKEENISHLQLSKEYKVSEGCIQLIIHNKRWKDKNYIFIKGK